MPAIVAVQYRDEQDSEFRTGRVLRGLRPVFERSVVRRIATAFIPSLQFGEASETGNEMTIEDTHHAEPPSFVKWLLWLFRKETWKRYPVVASFASVIVISAVGSALYGIYDLFPKDDAVRPKKPHLSLNAVRFLEENPDKIDVLLSNSGDTVAVLDKAVFTIHEVHVLSPNVIRTDALLYPPRLKLELGPVFALNSPSSGRSFREGSA